LFVFVLRSSQPHVDPITKIAGELLGSDCVVLTKVAAQEMSLEEVCDLIRSCLHVKHQDFGLGGGVCFSYKRELLKVALRIRKRMPLVNKVNRFSNLRTKDWMWVHFQERQESMILIVVLAEAHREEARIDISIVPHACIQGL